MPTRTIPRSGGSNRRLPGYRASSVHGYHGLRKRTTDWALARTLRLLDRSLPSADTFDSTARHQAKRKQPHSSPVDLKSQRPDRPLGGNPVLSLSTEQCIARPCANCRALSAGCRLLCFVKSPVSKKPPYDTNVTIGELDEVATGTARVDWVMH